MNPKQEGGARRTRRWPLVLAAALLALAALVPLGPRVDLSLSQRPVVLPPLDRLDAWLAQSEAAVPGLIAGTEKRIFWTPSGAVRTPLALVYVHGFSATRQEISPVAETVARDLGANLFATRLRGHGLTDTSGLARVRLADWIDDVDEALAVGAALGDQVVVLAFSNGVPLVLTALASQPDRAAALVLLSGNFEPADKALKLTLLPWGPLLPRLVLGPTRSWTPANAGQARYWSTSYPSEAILTVAASVQKGAELDLSRFRAPVLMLYAPDDDVVDLAVLRQRFAAFGSPRKVLASLPGAHGHVWTGDLLAPALTPPTVQAIEDFLRPLGP